MTRDELKQVMEEIFEERARVDAVTHGIHHAWLEARIESEKARKELFQKVTIAVVQWSVLGIIAWCWSYITGHFKLPF